MITLVLLLVNTPSFQAQTCSQRPRQFDLFIEAGPSLNDEEIISSHDVTQPVRVNCLILCFKEATCVGFNFRTTTNENATNCQLGNKTKKTNGASDGNWTFAQEVITEVEAITEATPTSSSAPTDVNGELESTMQRLVRMPTLPAHESCKQIWMQNKSNSRSGVYQIWVGENVNNVYCQMESVSGCSGGGWTMVMKIDGSLSTFRYGSSYWTDKSTYEDLELTGFDRREFKGSTYWQTSFQDVCVGMNHKGNLKAISFSYTAASLYDLIADGIHRPTAFGRAKWKSLISGSSLQPNCNRKGFNVFPVKDRPNAFMKVRLGIVSNQESDCHTPDSFIGLGADSVKLRACEYSITRNVAGNAARCSSDKGNKNAKAMGYLLVR